MNVFNQIGTLLLAPAFAVALLSQAPIALADATAPAAPAAPVAPALTAPNGDMGHQQFTPQQRADMRAQWEAMSPADRQAKMEQMRAAHEANMTPAQKTAETARRAQWQAMSPAQRQAAHQGWHGRHQANQ